MIMRDQVKAALEAILFVRAERVSTDELVKLLDISPADLKIILDEMIIEYNELKRGIQIVAIDNTYTMCSKPEYSDILNRMHKNVKKKLSPAAMETLAIVAYRQPVTRLDIERIRGVKSDRIIYMLLEKGLIEEAGYKDVPGKPVLFRTGEEFLRLFGLRGLEELPDIEGK